MARRTTYTWRKSACAVLAGVMCFAVTPSHALTDRAKAAGLVPHKALYDIQLAKNKNGSQVVNISGQMMYEWHPSCDAWVSNHKFNLVYEYADSPPMQIVSDYSTYESFDGKTLSFASQRKRDGRLIEELRGHAAIDKDAVSSEAIYSLPKNLVFELPKGALFPVNHTLSVLKKIREGKKFYNATIFDGSDEDGPVEVNSFIGKLVDVSGIVVPNENLDQSLIKTDAWRMRLAFFPLNNSDLTADYEMAMVFHENGVVSDMIVEYEDFSVSQRLVALEPLDETCHQDETKRDVVEP